MSRAEQAYIDGRLVYRWDAATRAGVITATG